MSCGESDFYPLSDQRLDRVLLKPRYAGLLRSLIAASVVCVLAGFQAGLVQPGYAQSDRSQPVQKKRQPEETQALQPHEVQALHPDGQLSEYDHGALGLRTPVVLVHGMAPDPGPYQNWGLFLDFLKTSPQMNRQFKIYLFTYHSEKPIAESTEGLKRVILTLAAQQRLSFKSVKNAGETSSSDNAAPHNYLAVDAVELSHELKVSSLGSRWNQPPGIKIIALSLGGLLARDALLDPQINPLVEQVITIGTPFHGTPLADYAWVKKEASQEGLFSTTRITEWIALGVIKKKFPSFAEDFCWDNFDGTLPGDVLKKQSPLCQRRGSVLNHPSLSDISNKLVTYSSFFNPDANAREALVEALNLPQTEESVILTNRRNHKLFSNPFNKHNLMVKVNLGLAKLPLGDIIADPSADTGTEQKTKVSQSALLDSTPMMSLNDGVSPIASHLWLGRFLPAAAQSHKQKTDARNRPLRREQWAALKTLQAQQNARLFPNIDHRDWLEGQTRTGDKQVADILHPDAKARSVFEWLLTDLMRDNQTMTGTNPAPVQTLQQQPQPSFAVSQ